MPKIKTREPVAQWYVVNTFSGTEKQFVHDIKSKINAYGLSSQVQDIRLVTEIVHEEHEIKREDAPKSLKNTKTTTWQVLPNGNYKKIVVREKNKYAGYVFVKTILDDDTWFLIRNTQGVTGFIGSSGKGTKPFPITPEEILSVLGYQLGDVVRIISETNKGKEGILTLSEKTGDPAVELADGKVIPVMFYEIEKVVVEKAQAQVPGAPTAPKVERAKAHFEVGNTVELKSGQMAGLKGTVVSINTNRSTALVSVDLFGRTTDVEANFEDIVVDK